MNYKIEVKYWKLFNVTVRLFGFIFLLVGLGTGIWGIIVTLNPKALKLVLNVDDFMFNLLIIFVFTVCTVIGFLAIKLEPYFPKHIKTRMQEEKDPGVRK